MALLQAPERFSFAEAALFGLALTMMIALADFDARFHGAELEPLLIHNQLIYWIGLLAAAAASLVALIFLAVVVTGLIATPIGEIVAGVAVLFAFLAILRGTQSRRVQT